MFCVCNCTKCVSTLMGHKFIVKTPKLLSITCILFNKSGFDSQLEASCCVHCASMDFDDTFDMPTRPVIFNNSIFQICSVNATKEKYTNMASAVSIDQLIVFH